MAEVERNLARLTAPLEAQRLINMVRRAFPEALELDSSDVVPLVGIDPKDWHVAGTTITASADFIVTANLRDFSPDTLSEFGVQALSPDDFLLRLSSTWSTQLIEILAEQARDLKHPPVTLVQLITLLENHAPRFARAVQQHLKQVESSST